MLLMVIGFVIYSTLIAFPVVLLYRLISRRDGGDSSFFLMQLLAGGCLIVTLWLLDARKLAELISWEAYLVSVILTGAVWMLFFLFIKKHSLFKSQKAMPFYEGMDAQQIINYLGRPKDVYKGKRFTQYEGQEIWSYYKKNYIFLVNKEKVLKLYKTPSMLSLTRFENDKEESAFGGLLKMCIKCGCTDFGGTVIWGENHDRCSWQDDKLSMSFCFTLPVSERFFLEKSGMDEENFLRACLKVAFNNSKYIEIAKKLEDRLFMGPLPNRGQAISLEPTNDCRKVINSVHEKLLPKVPVIPRKRVELFIEELQTSWQSCKTYEGEWDNIYNCLLSAIEYDIVEKSAKYYSAETLIDGYCCQLYVHTGKNFIAYRIWRITTNIYMLCGSNGLRKQSGAHSHFPGTII